MKYRFGDVMRITGGFYENCYVVLYKEHKEWFWFRHFSGNIYQRIEHIGKQDKFGRGLRLEYDSYVLPEHLVELSAAEREELDKIKMSERF